MADYLHNHPQFVDLIRIVASERGIDPALVEKDYWIMHCLYGLQQLGLTFQLKGGTSLSKGFQVIDRFSEDIDIRIEPPPDRDVKTGRNQTKPAQVQSRKDFYDWLATTIKIDGIEKVERYTAFDNKNFFSAGIRLSYKRIHADWLLEGIIQPIFETRPEFKVERVDKLSHPRLIDAQVIQKLLTAELLIADLTGLNP